jgi:hypothetical protein
LAPHIDAIALGVRQRRIGVQNAVYTRAEYIDSPRVENAWLADATLAEYWYSPAKSIPWYAVISVMKWGVIARPHERIGGALERIRGRNRVLCRNFAESQR